MLLSSSPLCSLASVDQRITSESREVKCARTSCRRVQMLLQEERGMRLCSAHIRCVRARLFTATSQDTTHLFRLLPALLRHWEFTAATVSMCARSPFITVLGLVTIYHPFLPPLPLDLLAHRCPPTLNTHVTCMCDAQGSPWFYTLHLLQIFIDLIINQGSSTVLCAQN